MKTIENQKEDTTTRSHRLVAITHQFQWMVTQTHGRTDTITKLTLRLTVHVPFVFILDEGVTPRFARVGVVDHTDSFDRSVRFELSSQFGFGSVVVDSSDEEGFEGIASGVRVRVGIPQRQVLKEKGTGNVNMYVGIN